LDESDIITYETGSSIETPLSFAAIVKLYFAAARGPICTKFGSLIKHADYCDVVEVATGRKIPIW